MSDCCFHSRPLSFVSYFLLLLRWPSASLQSPETASCLTTCTCCSTAKAARMKRLSCRFVGTLQSLVPSAMLALGHRATTLSGCARALLQFFTKMRLPLLMMLSFVCFAIADSRAAWWCVSMLPNFSKASPGAARSSSIMLMSRSASRGLDSRDREISTKWRSCLQNIHGCIAQISRRMLCPGRGAEAQSAQRPAAQPPIPQQCPQLTRAMKRKRMRMMTTLCHTFCCASSFDSVCLYIGCAFDSVCLKLVHSIQSVCILVVR